MPARKGVPRRVLAVSAPLGWGILAGLPRACLGPPGAVVVGGLDELAGLADAEAEDADAAPAGGLPPDAEGVVSACGPGQCLDEECRAAQRHHGGRGEQAVAGDAQRDAD